MKTASEIILKKPMLLEQSKKGSSYLIEEVVDACHEFADQFKKWIVIDPNNKPTKEIPVMCFTPNIGQEIGAYKIGCYWYRVSDGQKIHPTHFHYQLPNPQ